MSKAMQDGCIFMLENLIASISLLSTMQLARFPPVIGVLRFLHAQLIAITKKEILHKMPSFGSLVSFLLFVFG